MRALQQQVNTLSAQNAALEASLRTTDHRTRSCTSVWSDHDDAESSTSTDEKDACRSERLGKATSVLRQRGRLLRAGQEGREPRVGCVPEGTLRFDVWSGVEGRSHTVSAVALGVPESEAAMSTELDRQVVHSFVTHHRR